MKCPECKKEFDSVIVYILSMANSFIRASHSLSNASKTIRNPKSIFDRPTNEQLRRQGVEASNRINKICNTCGRRSF